MSVHASAANTEPTVGWSSDQARAVMQAIAASFAWSSSSILRAPAELRALAAATTNASSFFYARSTVVVRRRCRRARRVRCAERRAAALQQRPVVAAPPLDDVVVERAVPDEGAAGPVVPPHVSSAVSRERLLAAAVSTQLSGWMIDDLHRYFHLTECTSRTLCVSVPFTKTLLVLLFIRQRGCGRGHGAGAIHPRCAGPPGAVLGRRRVWRAV